MAEQELSDGEALLRWQVLRLMNMRSPERLALVEVPALSWICLSSVVATMIFTALIVIMQVREERERRVREHMASRARRLRYKKYCHEG